MLHIVALIERRFPRHARAIVASLLLACALALAAGLLLATQGAG
ncbi:hypothetical protein QFW77_14050 [Luteimonas sp. RD2P54]|uniref:ABC transporter permease n=1 Tax=Luteimonas endophytica TaxID=3042023 RepID=A0ABT6JB96_9GAMM|nr:hypothetical protein [Luteimonas endophytica]MDH5824100.1 hypothetical protein [Luteimonas endophytica]